MAKKISGGQSVENSEKANVKTVGEWRQKSEGDRVSERGQLKRLYKQQLGIKKLSQPTVYYEVSALLPMLAQAV